LAAVYPEAMIITSYGTVGVLFILGLSPFHDAVGAAELDEAVVFDCLLLLGNVLKMQDFVVLLCTEYNAHKSMATETNLNAVW
jgi:hypothetical protein